MGVLKEKFKNKKGLIYIIIVVIAIGLIITLIISNNLKNARNANIAINLTSLKGEVLYIIGQMGNSLDNVQSDDFTYRDSVVLVLYDRNNEWLLGIELDKNANKITRIYGSEEKKCEPIFREKLKERLSEDFNVG